MKSSKYWQERFIALEQAIKDNSKEHLRDIEAQYRRAIREIEKDINSWYGRIAANNGEISFEEAQKLLRGNELEEFKWTLEDYIKYGKENALSGEWIRELENASAKAHITRLEALKLQIQNHVENLYHGRIEDTRKVLEDGYTQSYYHTAYEVAKGSHVGTMLGSLDPITVTKIVSKPWAPDGLNFSDRIWRDKKKLINNLSIELDRTLILGKSPAYAIRNIQNNLRVSKAEAKRIVTTELTFVQSAGEKDSLNMLGIEMYEFVATLDSKTSAICQEMDGKTFKVSDMAPGLNAPPMHPHCRSCTCPYFGDDEEMGLVGERAAKDAKGKTYYVPGDMTYKEWKDEYISVIPNVDRYRFKYSKEKTYIERSNKPSITARKASNYDKIYKSINSTLSKKQVIDGTKVIDESYKLIEKETKIKNKPNIIFIGRNEMGSNAIASYDACNNSIYVSQLLFDGSDITELTKEFYKGEDPRSTIIHELCHVIQHERAMEHFTCSYRKLLKNMGKKTKYNKLYGEMVNASVDMYEKQGYTNAISIYASDMYLQDKKYEIEAEYLVKKYLK